MEDNTNQNIENENNNLKNINEDLKEDKPRPQSVRMFNSVKEYMDKYIEEHPEESTAKLMNEFMALHKKSCIEDNKENIEIEKDIKDLESTFATSIAIINKILKTKDTQVINTKNNLDDSIKNMKNEIDSLKEIIIDKDKALSDIQDKLNKCEATITDLNKEKNTLETQIKDIQKELEVEKKSNSKLIKESLDLYIRLEKYKETESRNKELERENIKLELSETQQKEKFNSLEDNFNELKNNYNLLSEENKTLKIAKDKAELDHTKELIKKDNEVNILKDKSDTKDKEITNLKKSLSSKDKELKDFRDKFEKAKHKITELEGNNE